MLLVLLLFQNRQSKGERSDVRNMGNISRVHVVVGRIHRYYPHIQAVIYFLHQFDSLRSGIGFIADNAGPSVKKSRLRSPRPGILRSRHWMRGHIEAAKRMFLHSFHQRGLRGTYINDDFITFTVRKNVQNLRQHSRSSPHRHRKHQKVTPAGTLLQWQNLIHKSQIQSRFRIDRLSLHPEHDIREPPLAEIQRHRPAYETKSDNSQCPHPRHIRAPSLSFRRLLRVFQLLRRGICGYNLVRCFRKCSPG